MPANEFNARVVELLNDLLTMDQEITSSLVWAIPVDDVSEAAIADAEKSVETANGLMSIVERLCGQGVVEIEMQADGQVASFKLNGAETAEREHGEEDDDEENSDAG